MRHSCPAASRVPAALISGFVCSLLVLWQGRLKAQDLEQLETHLIGSGEYDNETVVRDQTSKTSQSLSDNGGGARWSGSVRAAYGSGRVQASSQVPKADNIDFGYGGGANIVGGWIDTFSVTTPYLGVGKLRFKMQASDSLYADLYSSSAVGVFCGRTDEFVYARYAVSAGGDGNLNGDLPSDFTFDLSSGSYPLNGQQFTVDFQVQATANSRSVYYQGEFWPANSAKASVILRCAGFDALDDNDQPVDFTITSKMGSSAAVNLPTNGSFSTFSLTNAAPDSSHTTIQLLDGTASTPTEVAASLSAPPEQLDIKPVSDLVELSGINTDPLVIQISFDPAAVQAKFGSALHLELAWFDTFSRTWKNAVLGNHGITTPNYINRAYDALKDFHLGNFGLDTVNGVVWAVLNHNSQFIVTVPPPVLALNSVTMPSPHQVHLDCTGEPARANRLEVSTDLQTWTTLATAVAEGTGHVQFDDTAATGTQKFYRLAYP